MNPVIWLYRSIYTLGLYSARYSKRFFRRFFRLLVTPFSYLIAALSAVRKAADVYILKAFHEATADFRLLFVQIRASLARGSSGKPLPLRIARAFRLHRRGFMYVADFLLPAAALAILIFTVSRYSGTTFALSVTYNGTPIGFVQSEDTITQASSRTAALLNSGVRTVTQSEIEEPAAYTLTAVNKTELCDADILAESILSFYTEDYINACAVYINGDLLCAVESENDAVSSFDRLLEERRGTNTNATISFVEDVTFEQCLLPKGSSLLKSSQQLYNSISTVNTASETYTVRKGDDIEDILELFDGDADLLLQLNPNIDTITVPGTQVVLTPPVNTLSTKATFTNERTVALDYESIELETEELYSGDKKTVQSGSTGTGRITELVTYVDGILVSSEEISRATISEPVNEIIKLGTKARNNSYVGPYTVAVTSGVFIWPVVGLYTIYSWYGYRNMGFHTGIDISGGSASGSLIVAAESGTVVAAGSTSGGYGNRVIIDHGNGVRTLYAHCLDDSIMVSAGDSVTQGQAIARVGNTGNSFGAHLHFEVIINGTAVNPAPYIGLS